MTLPDIFNFLLRWWWVVVLTVAIGVGTAVLASSQMTPIYEADATILIEHQLDSGTANLESIQAAERRTLTLSRLVTSRPVLSSVIEELELPFGTEELDSKISVSHTMQTQLVTVSVRDADRQLAADIANSVTEQFAAYVQETQAPAIGELGTDVSSANEELVALMGNAEARIAEIEAAGEGATAAEQEELAQLQSLMAQYESALAVLTQIDASLADFEGRLGSEVRIAEPAIASTSPVSPRTTLNMSIAGVMGLLVGFGLVVLLGYLDDRVKTARDVRDLTDQDLIGAIPQQQFTNDVERTHGGQSLTGEIFQGLRTNLEFAMEGDDIRSIMVTSSRQEEGKSTVAANLAVTLAENGKRVILVDADLRRPSVHRMFRSVRNHKGLSNLLHLRSTDIESALQPTKVNNLRVLTTGPLPKNPAVLLNSPAMQDISNALEQQADIVVFDSPPVPISDTLSLSRLMQGIVYVVRAGKIRSAELTSEMENLSRSGVPILGVVLNGVRPSAQPTMRVYQHYYAADPDFMSDADGTGRLRWISRVFPWKA